MTETLLATVRDCQVKTIKAAKNEDYDEKQDNFKHLLVLEISACCQTQRTAVCFGTNLAAIPTRELTDCQSACLAETS
jgi:hypothetical protein